VDRAEVTSPVGKVVLGVDGLDSWLAEHPGPERGFAVAIGGRGGRDRLEIHSLLVARGLTPVSVCHPTAWVSPTAVIGAGSQFLGRSFLGTAVTVGSQCIVNTAATVDHECSIGDGVHIGPGATLAGEVKIEDNVFVGAGATVLPRVHLGADSVVGAGAVVTADVPPGETVAGVPAATLG